MYYYSLQINWVFMIKKTYRMMMVMAASITPKPIRLQGSLRFSKGSDLAPQRPEHLQQQKIKPTHGISTTNSTPTAMTATTPA
jgi:hypothetical protein